MKILVGFREPLVDALNFSSLIFLLKYKESVFVIISCPLIFLYLCLLVCLNVKCKRLQIKQQFFFLFPSKLFQLSTLFNITIQNSLFRIFILNYTSIFFLETNYTSNFELLLTISK